MQTKGFGGMGAADWMGVGKLVIGFGSGVSHGHHCVWSCGPTGCSGCSASMGLGLKHESQDVVLSVTETCPHD